MNEYEYDDFLLCLVLLSSVLQCKKIFLFFLVPDSSRRGLFAKKCRRVMFVLHSRFAWCLITGVPNGSVPPNMRSSGKCLLSGRLGGSNMSFNGT